MKSIEIRAEAELDIKRDLGTRMAMVERFPYRSMPLTKRVPSCSAEGGTGQNRANTGDLPAATPPVMFSKALGYSQRREEHPDDTKKPQ